MQKKILDRLDNLEALATTIIQEVRRTRTMIKGGGSPSPKNLKRSENITRILVNRERHMQKISGTKNPAAQTTG